MVKDNTHYSRTRPMTEVWEKEAGDFKSQQL
jgi:hypothetical protein